MRFENWTIEDLFTRCMDCDDMTLEMDKEEFAALRIKIAELQHRSTTLQSGNSEAIQDFLRVLDEYPEQLVPINRNSAVVRALRNAAVGNSAQPEPVNQTYKLPPNSFADDELMGMAHGDNPVANAYRELLEFRRNAAGGNSGQPVTVTDEKLPLDYLQGQKDGLEWAAQMAEANHPETGDWLYDDTLELAKAIRKGPDMPESFSDCWIPVSERMPDKLIPVMVMYEDGDMWSAIWSGQFWDDGCAIPDPHSITHWRDMPDAPKAPDSQLTQVPEDRLQKAIVDACMVFLHGCGNGYKNHEGHFYDVETEHSFCIWEVAEQIGVVKETGNYKWSLCKEMEDDIEEVYRKYAMRIMEAAPKVKP